MKNVMEKEVESVVTTEIRSQLAILGKRIRSMNTQSISFNQHEKVDARIKAVEAELGRKKVALVTLPPPSGGGGAVVCRRLRPSISL